MIERSQILEYFKTQLAGFGEPGTLYIHRDGRVAELQGVALLEQTKIIMVQFLDLDRETLKPKDEVVKTTDANIFRREWTRNELAEIKEKLVKEGVYKGD